MRFIVIITLSLYLCQLSSEKPGFLNWFGGTEPARRSSDNLTMIIQDLTRRYKMQETQITKLSKRLKKYDKFKKTSRNRFRPTTTKTTTAATTLSTRNKIIRTTQTTTSTTSTTTTTMRPSNIIFESNEDIDFSACHPDDNQACVLDQVYSCTTSKECDESGRCERKSVCGIKLLSKIKD